MWWIFNIFRAIFADKIVEDIVDEVGPAHIEPEESDWDWSDNPDANPDLKNTSFVIPEPKVSLFFGEISQFVERGFGSPQIAAILTKSERVELNESFVMNYNVRAFGRGTTLKIGLQRFSDEHMGVMIWSNSEFSAKVASLIPKYDIGADSN